MRPALTQERLRQLFSYDPITGVFTRLAQRDILGRRRPPFICGSTCSQPYIRIMIDRRPYWAHRLAFFWMTGAMPEGLVDHINGDGRDNRWENLRAVSYQQNTQANHRQNRNNTSGFRGVYPIRGRWKAKIMVDHREVHLGTFDAPELAAKAYQAAKERLHFR